MLAWRVSGKQHNGCTVVNFCARANNYKRTLRKIQFHEHYLQSDHNVISDCEITIIDHPETGKSLRQNELHWYHKLKKFDTFGHIERDVYGAY